MAKKNSEQLVSNKKKCVASPNKDASYLDPNKKAPKRIVINTFAIDDGCFEFYYDTVSYFLNFALLDDFYSKNVIWESHQAIWQADAPIDPLTMAHEEGAFIFHYMENDKTKILRFSVENLLSRAERPQSFIRSDQNPIMHPISEHDWESCAVLNPGAVEINGKTHLIYRSISGGTGLSYLGHAAGKDGVHFNERSLEPILRAEDILSNASPANQLLQSEYVSGGSWAGYEDPRLTKIGEVIYMTHTLFDGVQAPRVGLSSISVENFLKKNWCWSNPIQISPRGEAHKNWVLFPNLINGRYAILHSISPSILIEYIPPDIFESRQFIIHSHHKPAHKRNSWDSHRRGAGASPILTPDGWLLFYHANDYREPEKYKIGAMILDFENPEKIRYRTVRPILEPETRYEMQGLKPGIVYSCGAVIKGDQVLLYYGAADSVICVASIKYKTLLHEMKHPK